MTIFDSLDELNEGVCMFKFMAAAALAINQTSYKDLNDDEQFGMQTTLQAISDKLDNVKDSINSQLRKSHD